MSNHTPCLEAPFKRQGRRSLLLGGLIFGVAGCVFAGLFDDWQYRLKITFPEGNPAAPLTNFQALVVLGTNIAGFETAQFESSDGGDLRFADSNETTALNYEIEKLDSNGTATVWVQVPWIAGTGDYIQAYWGKTSVVALACTTNGATWSNAYYGVWHFQQTNTGTQAGNAIYLNSVSTNRSGLDYVSDTGKVGRTGPGQSFGGTEGNDYILIPSSGMDPTTNTISFWFMTRQIAVARAIMSVGGSSGDTTPYSIFLHTAGGGLQAYANGYYGVTGSGETGRWYHVAIRRLDGTMKVYVDGVEKLSVSPGTYGNIGSIWWGVGYTGYLRGGLDEVRVANRAHDADWIRAEWLTVASNSVFTRYDGVSAPGTKVRVQALAASQIGPDRGQANGRVLLTGVGGNPAITVCWGPADGGTNSFPGSWAMTQTMGSAWAEGQAFNYWLTNLVLANTYYYRFYATNSTGSTWSELRSFLTVTNPTVTNFGATTVKRRTALLRGEVTSTGGLIPMSSGFEWWIVGGSVTSRFETGSLTGRFEVAVANLVPGQSYLYRVWASNSVGLGVSSSSGFATWSAAVRDWYVSTHGDQTTGDSWGTAFTHFPAVFAEVWPGDTVHLAGQTFRLSTELNWPNIDSVTMKGGYAATNASGLGPNDPLVWPTILCPGTGATIRLLKLQSVSNPRIEQITFRDGYPVDLYGGDVKGGALHATTVTNLGLIACRFINCSGQKHGGALYADRCSGLISNSWFIGNTSRSGADQWGYGGALYLDEGTWTVTDSVLAMNRVPAGSSLGGGAYLAGGSHVFHNVLIVNNTVSGSFTLQGGGLYVTGSGSVQLENCTLAHNCGGPALYRAGGTVSVVNSILWSNAVSDFGNMAASSFSNSCAGGLTPGVQGNLSQDPLFEIPLWYLAPGSACLNAGDRLAAEAGLGGYTTQTNGGLDGAMVDLGYHAPEGLTFSLDLYVQPDGNDGNTGLAPGSGTALRSITRALSMASARTRIHVGAGTYPNGVETFPLTISEKTIQIIGTNRMATMIDASLANQRALLIQYAVGANRIEGITLQNGYALNGYGGGLYVQDSVVTLESCRLQNNRAVGCGGGFFASHSQGLIRNTWIESNTALSDGPGWAIGGGGYLYYGAWTLWNVGVNQNRAPALSALGGGLYMVSGIHDLYDVLMAGNMISGSYTLQGGGCYVTGYGSVRLENCTVANNTNGMGVFGAGGIVSVVNSILWSNTPTEFSGLTVDAFSYSCATTLTAGVQGNITNEPSFKAAGIGDYRLVNGGPGIDIGLNRNWMIRSLDLAGTPRIKGGIVDMGAYETPLPHSGVMLNVW